MKRTNLLLYTLALVKLILPFFLQDASYQPHRDEMLYLAEGRHMAWGFMEVPPLLSVFAWLIHICGDGFFWVKFWPSLFGALTYLVTGRIILSLGGQVFALLLGFLPFVFGGYLRVHFLFQPNALEYLGWLCIVYTLIRYIQTQKNGWLYAMGISCGLGMLSKYSVAFFIISLVAGLLLTQQRKIFLNKHLYFSIVLAFIIFLPNLLWQYSLHFPVIYHMHELQQKQLQYVGPGTFLSAQLLMNLPCVFIWIAGLWALFFVKRFSSYRFVAFGYIGVIILLLLGHGKGYYALGAYPVLFAFGAVQLEQATIFRFAIVRILLVAIPVALGYWVIPITLPVKDPAALASFYQEIRTVHQLGVLRWEDGKDHPLPQDFADMLGWEEMAQKTAKAYHELSAEEKKKTLVFSDNYGEAGALNYYADKYDLPKSYSDNASFLYWLPDTKQYDHLLLVTDDKHEMEHHFIQFFQSAQLKDSVTSTYARERGTQIILLKGMNDSMHYYLNAQILRAKAKTSPVQ